MKWLLNIKNDLDNNNYTLIGRSHIDKNSTAKDMNDAFGIGFTFECSLKDLPELIFKK